jgi:hypothetical protein
LISLHWRKSNESTNRNPKVKKQKSKNPKSKSTTRMRSRPAALLLAERAPLLGNRAKPVLNLFARREQSIASYCCGEMGHDDG